jgi:hypothetical protein
MLLKINEKEFDHLVKEKLLEPISANKYKLYCINIADFNKVKVVKDFQLDRSVTSIEVEVEVSSAKHGSQLKIIDSNGHANVEEWIDDWRSSWSGKRVKGMGVKQDCITKMKEFFKSNPEYSKEDVFAARDIYFKDILKQYGNYQYLRQADHFIKKQDKVTSEVHTDLVIYCEQVKFNKENNKSNDESKYTVFDDL